MELKKGMYARYKYEEIVFIGKITFVSEVMCGLDETLQIDIDNCIEEILKKDIIKASYNIIDLIEVGDYVNGLKVTNVDGTYHGRKDKAIYCDYCQDKETGKWTMIYDDEIKSIVTKEQFSQMEYKVGD